MTYQDALKNAVFQVLVEKKRALFAEQAELNRQFSELSDKLHAVDLATDRAQYAIEAYLDK